MRRRRVDLLAGGAGRLRLHPAAAGSQVVQAYLAVGRRAARRQPHGDGEGAIQRQAGQQHTPPVRIQREPKLSKPQTGRVRQPFTGQTGVAKVERLADRRSGNGNRQAGGR